MRELLESSLVRHKHSVDHSTNADHGETAVLKLVELKLLQRSRVLTEPERVEAKVARLALALKSLLDRKVGNRLEHGNEQQNLRHASSLKVVVVRVGREHLGEVLSTECEHFLDQKTNRCKHTHAAVLQLRLTQEAHVNVVRDHQRVELRVSSPAIEVLRLEQKRNGFRHRALHPNSRRLRAARALARSQAAACRTDSRSNERCHFVSLAGFSIT
mmetsp:Transcript_15473/g.33354  ORF Transcript_15473/g.33354 Transcript_15473/m.33354 type:complete len:215 (-) Transcript_15473:64-708(-)